jgi:hypothetical protein
MGAGANYLFIERNHSTKQDAGEMRITLQGEMRIMMHSIETKLSRNIQEVLRGNDWERI